MKTCSGCKVEKSFEAFSKQKNGKFGLRSKCRECLASEWAGRPTEKRKEYRMWSRYRLTKEAYEAMVAKGCEVCGEKEDLHIDHDHSCCPGEQTCGNCLRGVLCGRCNRAEGLLDSDPDRALALAMYMLQNVNLIKEVIE